MKRTIPFLLLVLAAAGISAVKTVAQSGGCAPSGGLNFICGLQAPEDLVLIPNTHWLISSGMAAGSGLHLIDTQAKTARSLFGPGVSSSRTDRTKFASCPGLLDPKQAILHGLSLRPAQAGHYALYATNHGGRESIEVFDLDVSGPAPSVTWTGCVPMPNSWPANSVSVFADGTIIATVLVLPGKTFQDVWAGRNTGLVVMWTPGSREFRTLAGTELPGNNGIETSPDDREFFVASIGLKRVVAYSRANPSKPLRFAQLKEIGPDNLRWVGDRLYTAGIIDNEPACGGAPKKPEDIQCPRGWVVNAIDPGTMAVTEIARGPRAAPYTGTATAIPVGGNLWLSSFNVDRIAYRPLK
jgi:hypothetical protein